MSFSSTSQAVSSEELLRRNQLSTQLKELEDTKSNLPPVSLVRQALALEDQLTQSPRWSDSQSAITASFYNLIKDTKDNLSYLSYTDISARLRALITWGATHLSEDQARSLTSTTRPSGIVGLSRSSSAAAEEDATARLRQPGGMAWEVARQTPEPFVDEAVRRGGQVKTVAVKVGDKATPVAESLKDKLDREGLTNPLVGIAVLGMLVFMKNKYLAVALSGGLVFLVKGSDIKESVMSRVPSLPGT